MPSNLLRDTYKYLELLSHINNKKTRFLVLKDLNKVLKKDIFSSLSEICQNIIEGNIKFSKTDKIKLRKYKELIVDIANKPKNPVKQHNLLVQSGGFVHFILPVVATLLGELILDKVRKNGR